MQDFILFIWPLMAYLLKWAFILVVLYIIGSLIASGKINVRNVLRYTIFIIIFPFMLIIGFIMRAITHPSDRP